MTGGTYYYSTVSFGAVLDHAQYELLPDEKDAWVGSSPSSPEERKKAAELKEAAKEIKALRRRYEAEGYHEALSKELVRISDTYFTRYMLGPIFELPDDVSALLDNFGNPLVDEDAEDYDEDTPAPVFDITSPAHWQAMQARIEWCNENQ
jgi:hypothetical protein